MVFLQDIDSAGQSEREIPVRCLQTELVFRDLKKKAHDP